MPPNNSETLTEVTEDLLRSLHSSIRRVRQASEAYLAEAEAQLECSPETTQLKPQIAKLDGLIRDIQKVEKTLVERENTAAPSDAAKGGEFDLCAARDEIERRLAELAAAIHAGDALAGDARDGDGGAPLSV